MGTARPPLDLLKVQFGVQDPGVPLPVGVERGALPERLTLGPAEVERFEVDGVLLVRGAVSSWVAYLREVVNFQVRNPHSLAVTASLKGGYEYVQINTWMTNNGIRDFLYYSAVGHVLAQLGRTEEVRISTDNLLVNPRRCLGWHQDAQTGPVDVEDALRFWAAMDPCRPGLGAPEYILGSHRDGVADRELCFVDLGGGAEVSSRTREFVIEPGDLLVWHARTVHRLVVQEDGSSYADGAQRRVISGTAVKRGARYWRRTKSGVMGDASGHDLRDGDPLQGPYFPRIFPQGVEAERLAREREELVARSPLRVFERKLQAQWEALSAGTLGGVWPF